MRAVAIFWLSLALPCAVLVRGKKPHILFILADDLGWNDVGWSLGRDFPTPNLDRLRQEGLEFTRFYTQPKCTPARAALLTGRYPFKIGLQPKKTFVRTQNNTLNYKYKLLPQYLKDLGYRTHLAGKWHLGHCNVNATPIARGFDTHFGPFANLIDRFNNTASNKRILDWNWNNQPYWEAHGTFSTHLLTNHTQMMLEKHFTDSCTKNDPIFMFLSLTVPHVPLQVPEKYITNSKCNLLPETAITVRYNVAYNESNARRTACGMVNAMDEGIGNITQTLERLGVLDDFLIFFTSDNGAHHEGTNNWPLRGAKANVFEGGTRVRTVFWAPQLIGKCPKTKEYDGLIHITDMFPTLIHLAKGNVSALPKDMDGRNVWWNIKKRVPTWRRWMVYNIHTEGQEAAIRFKNTTHDFKLIFYNVSDFKPGYLTPTPAPGEGNEALRKNYRLPGTAYFLYDLSTNPNERPPTQDGSSFPDAAQTHPALFQRMKQKLESFRTEEAEVPVYTLMGGAHIRDGAAHVGGC